MVLFKRKPVQFLPNVEVEDEDSEVWHIPQTGEIFSSYADFLERMDFYKQRRFNDEITGHSGLDFFDALNSELTGGKEVEEAFPEALKGPILRKVQFQTISRLDNLVDLVFDEFKEEYFPGEEVVIPDLHGATRVHASIRDKTTFGPRTLPDGTVKKPLTRYQVLVKSSGEEAHVTDINICRDRGVFTKAMLRSFIKRTVFREAWNGAPWLVKQEYARQYYIDTSIPAHLRYDTKLMERKMAQAQKKAAASPTVNGDGPVRLPELKPPHKGSKSKTASKGLKWPLSMAVHGAHTEGYSNSDANQDGHKREPSPPPPPPQPKYPIEDLELEPRSECMVRPQLKFVSSDFPAKTLNGEGGGNYEIQMQSVGPLLEVWDTLNVYCEVYKLDSFTFDDFVEAMTVASESVSVQLIDEMHCAVLKILVDSEADGGAVRIALPELAKDEDDEEEEDEEGDVDESRQETPEPESKPPARATRSSLAKQEAERLKAEAAAMEEAEKLTQLASKHRAEELLQDYDWIDALRRRDFVHGGWQRIIVGLLHQLSKKERCQQDCEDLLLELVPPGLEANQENVRLNHGALSVNSRIKLLQMLCMLSTETKAFRSYMDECNETMTQYRKEKIEWQRQRKQAQEELRQLNDQHKILLPDNMPPSPPATEVKAEDDEDVTEVEDSILQNGDDSQLTEPDVKSRSKRKSASKFAEEKKHLEEEHKSRQEQAQRKKKHKKKTEEKAPTPKGPVQSKQFVKLVKDIAAKEADIKAFEDEIAVIENDLREADCPRTRVLGKDRFWNRYYWFERNGMPYGGLPTSSTASAGYANGCIWVQGPDELERVGYIEVPEPLQREYQAKFNMTIPERKAREEGKTSVCDATQWGYLSDPAELDQLIEWLDARGFNELKLKKELLLFRDKIATHMENRKRYLSASEEKQEDGDGEVMVNNHSTAKATTKRTSSRIREKTPEPPSYRCLRWENTMALEAEDMGHLHSEPPPPPRVRKAAARKREAVEAVPAPPPRAKTRKR